MLLKMGHPTNTHVSMQSLTTQTPSVETKPLCFQLLLGAGFKVGNVTLSTGVHCISRGGMGEGVGEGWRMDRHSAPLSNTEGPAPGTIAVNRHDVVTNHSSLAVHEPRCDNRSRNPETPARQAIALGTSIISAFMPAQSNPATNHTSANACELFCRLF